VKPAVSRSPSRGPTLKEVAAVVAVLVVLGLLILPALYKAKQMGWRISCTNRLKEGSGLLILTTNLTVGWTAALHVNSGYVVLVDGSVQQAPGTRLADQLAHSGVETNRLLIP